MTQTLIQKYVSSLIRGMADRAQAVGELDHKVSKGRLREIFVRSILDRFLTSQFGVGSGIVVNQRGDQSSEQDVIIFDRRILPPFIETDGLGVFPIEAVLATIEIKSILTDTEIERAEINAQRLEELSRNGTIYKTVTSPSAAILGFRSKSLTCKSSTSTGSDWLRSRLSRIWAVTVIGEISWLRLSDWQSKDGDTEFEETKRFLSVFFDNLRTTAERQYRILTDKHHDWLSVYTRWDCSGAALLRGEDVQTIASTTTSSTSTSTTTPPPIPPEPRGGYIESPKDVHCDWWGAEICRDEIEC